MSVHDVPQPVGLFLEPAPPAVTPDLRSIGHHPKPEPAEHMCTCGKIREACVHDEVRAFWSAVSER